MSEAMSCAIVTGVIIGTMMAIPIWLCFWALRVLTRVVAKSKLTLDDYLDLELGENYGL